MQNMVRSGMWGWIFLLAVISCRQETTTLVSIRLDSIAIGSEITLSVRDSVYRAVSDSNRSVVFRLAGDVSDGYAYLGYERGGASVYIESGKNLDIWRDKEGKLYFEGISSRINNYLNSEDVQYFPVSYDLGEKDFTEAWAKQSDRCYMHLDSMDFGEAFRQVERRRLYYAGCNRLLLYPLNHARSLGLGEFRPTDDYYRSVEEMVREDETCIWLSEYRLAFERLVYMLGSKGMETDNRLLLLKRETEYIRKNIHSAWLSAHLIDQLFTEYVERNGVDGLEPLLPVYDRKVTDSKKRTRFKELYARWAKIACGRPAPDFAFRDVHGQWVKLTDFRGQYVYIDVWATWCYFCCKEIPALQKLEQEFTGKQVCFVSISCDKDITVWKKKVRGEELGGIQLNAGTDKTFMDAYLIRGIPRFILLDREGKILDANMTRPSEPETKKMLRALPGI